MCRYNATSLRLPVAVPLNYPGRLLLSALLPLLAGAALRDGPHREMEQAAALAGSGMRQDSPQEAVWKVAQDIADDQIHLNIVNLIPVQVDILTHIDQMTARHGIQDHAQLGDIVHHVPALDPNVNLAQIVAPITDAVRWELAKIPLHEVIGNDDNAHMTVADLKDGIDQIMIAQLFAANAAGAQQPPAVAEQILANLGDQVNDVDTAAQDLIVVVAYIMERKDEKIQRLADNADNAPDGQKFGLAQVEDLLFGGHLGLGLLLEQQDPDFRDAIERLAAE